MIKAVHSGGQTGADQGALRAAKRLGIPTGGWAPHNYRTEAGQALWLATEYGLKEHADPGYSARTRDNVRDTGATLIVGRPSSGCNLTQRYCGPPPIGFNKPWMWVPWPDYSGENQAIDGPEWLEYWGNKVHDWLALELPQDHNLDPAELILNVAGNREEMNPGIGDRTQALVHHALVLFI